jgi:hypothetical protein
VLVRRPNDDLLGVELPIEHRDATTTMRLLSERAETQRMVQERIAYREAKAREQEQAGPPKQ